MSAQCSEHGGQRQEGNWWSWCPQPRPPCLWIAPDTFTAFKTLLSLSSCGWSPSSGTQTEKGRCLGLTRTHTPCPHSPKPSQANRWCSAKRLNVRSVSLWYWGNTYLRKGKNIHEHLVKCFTKIHCALCIRLKANWCDRLAFTRGNPDHRLPGAAGLQSTFSEPGSGTSLPPGSTAVSSRPMCKVPVALCLGFWGYSTVTVQQGWVLGGEY